MGHIYSEEKDGAYNAETSRVYRAAVWVTDDEQGEVRMTEESDGALTDFELIDLGYKNMKAIGMDSAGGKIVITDWTE